MNRYILALDQGTTSSRAILFDHDGRIAGMAQKPFRQFFPQPGWVEHDPMEIWQTQSDVMRQVMEEAGVSPERIAGIGITNQRETTVVWDRQTGKPIHNAIVWQCRRTAELCEELKAEGWTDHVRERTGLVIDAYFSATKIKWILDAVPGARERAMRGEILFGTVDSWLVWNLTGGKVHVTDYSNASRTMLYDIENLQWDKPLMERLGIPEAMLPDVRPSSEIYGTTEPAILGGAVNIAGVIGDQQGALFGQTCWDPGMVKNTYGTGCFLLMQLGTECIRSESGLLTTIAWGIGNEVKYALEGSVFMGGALIQWLRDELGLIQSADETAALAHSVRDTHGAYIVPAFTGLGAPYWDMYARGTMVGLTRGVSKAHLIRAALEAIAYQSRDVIDAMVKDAGLPLTTLRVDGGATANDFLMQFQANLLDIPVERPAVTETTALGAAYLAGLAVGFWSSPESIRANNVLQRRFEPAMDAERRSRLYDGWKKAVLRSMHWAD